MLRKIITWLVILPPVVVLVAFAVANRQAVTLSFDPFSSTSPAYAATLPLFLLIFAVLIVGVIAGGIAAWFGQGKWRRRARSQDAELRALRQELTVAKARQADSGLPRTSVAPAPQPAIGPPVP